MQRLTSSAAPFCQPEASEPVDTQRPTLSSTPLSSKDGESDDMRGYLMVIHTFCQPEEGEPVDTRRFASSSAQTISVILTLESRDIRRYPSGYPFKLSFAISQTQSMIARRD